MERSYYVADAFTGSRFAGNPAAVVFDAGGLDDTELQAIAAEFNLSETTFVLPSASSDAHVQFRWFTPTTEVNMCGHATIAGVHALVEAGPIQPTETEEGAVIRIETRSGTLTAFVECLSDEDDQRLYWLELPRPQLRERSLVRDRLASVLNLSVDRLDASLPMMETQDGDLLVFVEDCLALNAARPDWTGLTAYQERERFRGLCLATVKTLTPSINVQSRFFAPSVGINEDPVTGSVHGPLALYLATQGLMSMEQGEGGLMCVQGKAGGRAGMVFVLLRQDPDDGYSVRIGGSAVTTMRGSLVG